jgi:hypothetical protein
MNWKKRPVCVLCTNKSGPPAYSLWRIGRPELTAVWSANSSQLFQKINLCIPQYEIRYGSSVRILRNIVERKTRTKEYSA